MDSVAEVFGVPVHAILWGGRGDDPGVIWARFAAYRLMRVKLGATYEQVGIMLRRDHSTVISGIRRADELLAGSPVFAGLYRQAEVRG